VDAKWRVKSAFDIDYQCIAWAECYTDRRSWPGNQYAWPPGLPLADPPESATVDHFLPRFRLLGYEPCGLDSSFEIGFQKVAIYANDQGVTHMARQHFFGWGWLSKPGKLEDIVHGRLEDIEGDMSAYAFQYGKVTLILKRSWLFAYRTGCLRRCASNAYRFWRYRREHGSWDIRKTI